MTHHDHVNLPPGTPAQGEEVVRVYRCRKCKALTTSNTHCYVKGPPLFPQMDDYSLCDRVDAVPLEALTAERVRRERLEGALAWLVRLKDGPRDESYEREKPQAWEAARELIASLAEDHRTPSVSGSERAKLSTEGGQGAPLEHGPPNDPVRNLSDG